MILAADSAGLSTQIHAIGDLAVDTLLDMFETTIFHNGPRDRRFRMIHAQVVEPDDFDRFGRLGIIAEVQPYHAIDDMRWMEERIGARASGAYAFRSADPVLGIYAAVTRQTLAGEPAGGWFPDERVTVEEALRAYTVNAAYAAFQEDWKGRIGPGYVADLVVLSDDLFAVPPERIKDVEVLAAMMDGRWVYRAHPPLP